MVIGCCSLGNAVTPYLIASGVGQIIIADIAYVKPENLLHYIYFSPQDMSKHKVDVLEARLKEHNPDLLIPLIKINLTLDLLVKFFLVCDAVVDSTDNHEIRQLINIASI